MYIHTVRYFSSRSIPKVRHAIVYYIESDPLSIYRWIPYRKLPYFLLGIRKTHQPTIVLGIAQGAHWSFFKEVGI